MSCSRTGSCIKKNLNLCVPLKKGSDAAGKALKVEVETAVDQMLEAKLVTGAEAKLLREKLAKS